MKKIRFSFEDLEVWQKAAASTSVALNIAEGKGRFSKKEFIQFLYIARGSLYETITLLIIFHKKDWINDLQLQEIRISGDEIGKMLSSLINSIKTSIK